MTREADGTNNFNTAPFFLKFTAKQLPGSNVDYVEELDITTLSLEQPDGYTRPVDIQGIKSLSVQIHAEGDFIPAIEIYPEISNSDGDDDLWFSIPADSFTPELVQPLVGNGIKNAMIVLNSTRAKYFRLRLKYIDEAASAGLLWAYMTAGEI